MMATETTRRTFYCICANSKVAACYGIALAIVRFQVRLSITGSGSGAVVESRSSVLTSVSIVGSMVTSMVLTLI